MSSFVRHKHRLWKRMSNLHDRIRTELWHGLDHNPHVFNQLSLPRRITIDISAPGASLTFTLLLPPNFTSAPLASFRTTCLRAMCNKTFAHTLHCGSPWFVPTYMESWMFNNDFRGRESREQAESQSGRSPEMHGVSK
jgi:hypothetical protein